eukprot:CAMPEP_0179154350 /NCGR_PEP_ID=MMETSP0796-20121207/75113_1 /TAXON_ID=73915 /ORGANISM="Pyrodinium bahamense, Strain pbaha01" /LENGTH=37 /DNA_ID= /DNA_START= /DNA_END= /DNA_ORIENTATION=
MPASFGPVSGRSVHQAVWKVPLRPRQPALRPLVGAAH